MTIRLQNESPIVYVFTLKAIQQLDQSHTRYKVAEDLLKKENLLQGNILKQVLKLKKELGDEVPEHIGQLIEKSYKAQKGSGYKKILFTMLACFIDCIYFYLGWILQRDK